MPRRRSLVWLILEADPQWSESRPARTNRRTPRLQFLDEGTAGLQEVWGLAELAQGRRQAQESSASEYGTFAG
jgi:hypothetical protein